MSMLLPASVPLGLVVYIAFHYWRPQDLLEALPFALVPPTVVFYAISHYEGHDILGVGVTTLVLFYALYGVCLLGFTALYRVSPFHPLARYPGPLLYKITKLSAAWVAWTGRQHLVNRRLHQKYGPFVRIGPNDLSIVDQSAIASVLGVGGLPKGQFHTARLNPHTPHALIAMNGSARARRRRLWNRGMSTEALKEYEMVISKRAVQLLAQLELKEKEDIDITAWFVFFSFDVMGSMVFGGGFEMLRDGRDRTGITEVIKRFNFAVNIISRVTWAAQLAQRMPYVVRDIQVFRAFAQETAAKRMRAGPVIKDLWYHLSDEAGLETSKPPMATVAADAGLAIIGGSDTTVAALTTLLYCILCHPTVYARLQDEIDTIFPPGSDALDVGKHDQLPFLDACINEALRLYPPALTGGVRQAGKDGAFVAGRYIPANTEVYLPLYSYHRDPRYFSPSPDEFIPDRWLNLKEEPVAFIPFSYGPANCVGRNLARMEMKMVMSLLLQKFSFTFAHDFDAAGWVDTLRDYLITVRGPMWIRVKCRQS